MYRDRGDVAACGGDECSGVFGKWLDDCLRPGFFHFGLPAVPQHPVKRFGCLPRCGRLVSAHIGLDGTFIGSDAIDIGGDAKPVDQAFVIKAVAAGSGKDDSAHRVHPDFCRMGGKLVAVIAVETGESIDWLARFLGPFKRLADIGEAGLPATDKTAEIKDNRLDAVILDRRINGVHDIAQAIFARAVATIAGQKILEGRRSRFFDNHAVQVEQQGTVADCAAIGLRRQQGIKRAEKQQHGDQHHAIL